MYVAGTKVTVGLTEGGCYYYFTLQATAHTTFTQDVTLIQCSVWCGNVAELQAMFIGVQPQRDARRRPCGNVRAKVPGGSAALKGTKRKAVDGTKADALVVFKPATTISRADASKINASDASGVSACLRCKIL